jgi:FSR family fosmidomycin resistance protein-like MFS transporter
MESIRRNHATIGVLSLAHLMNDLYSNYLPQMLIFLAAAIPDFTATRAATLISAFIISSSLSQPVFGFFLDIKGKRWLVYVGTLWMSFMLGLTGIVHDYSTLVILSALAGIGTAAFHPQASTMVNVLSGRNKALILSAFVAFGNIGYALGPVILIPLFQAYGLGITPYTVIPGIAAAALLILFTPRESVIAPSRLPASAIISTLRQAANELLAIIGVIAIRSLAVTALITFLPLYFKSKNMSNTSIGYLITSALFSGVVGGILGGWLSDRYGRKPLIVISLFITTPLFIAFLMTSGTTSIAFLILSGAALLSSMSVTIVAAQEAIPDNKAFAAGLTMGFAGGMGGLAVILIGYIADSWGLNSAMAAISILPLLSGIIAIFMKSRPAAHIK